MWQPRRPRSRAALDRPRPAIAAKTGPPTAPGERLQSLTWGRSKPPPRSQLYPRPDRYERHRAVLHGPDFRDLFADSYGQRPPRSPLHLSGKGSEITVPRGAIDGELAP